jgi:bifunctional non-homologous end joining protein LigD
VSDRDRRRLAGPADQLRPMLAISGELPTDDSQWAYEMKWDGIRAIANVADGAVTLVTRTGRAVSASYPELQGMAGALGGHQAVLDGEIVAFGGAAWPSFEVLQQRMNVSSASQVRQLAAEIPVTYLAFDLLIFDGEVLIGQPYKDRRERLDQLGLDGKNWQTPPAFIGVSGTDVQAVSQQHALEGIMAKRLESRYEPGKRSAGWRKIKNVHRQEFVVGGWRPGEGNRESLIGSLLVGVNEPTGLVYAGHVGTGFTQDTLVMLTNALRPLRRATSPFGSTVPPEHARFAFWVEPRLVIEATFGLWTTSGRLRAASYLGVRSDVDPVTVIREPTS